MTAQLAETLHYQGRQLAMCSTPLTQFLTISGGPHFQPNSTALWRGYRGYWEIIDDRLYLVKLNGTLSNGEQATLATLFPNFPDRVFAHWYNGVIRIPQGQLLEYVHAGYGSRYEQDLLLEFAHGVLVNSQTRQNGSGSGASDSGGYTIAAMTTLPTVPDGEKTS